MYMYMYTGKYSSTSHAHNVVLPPGTPTMQELLCFSDQKVNIVEQIGANYSSFGIFLLEDTTGAVVKALEKEYRGNAQEINMDIFRKWLQGKGLKPVAWCTLVNILQKIKLCGK